MIKLKQGDCVDMRGLLEHQREIIIDYFIECGATHIWTDYPYELVRDDCVFRCKESGDIDGYRHFINLKGYTMYDGTMLLALLRSQDDTSKGLTMEEMIEKHKEVREAVNPCSRNVVLTDYNTSKHEGTLEITITDGQEFNACFKCVGCVDSVEMNLDKEDFVELMKSWRKVINGAIEELED